MKTLIVIETVEELLNFASRVRAANDKSPSLPPDATLVFENNYETVRLQASGFTMENRPIEEVLTALVNRAGLKIHIT